MNLRMNNKISVTILLAVVLLVWGVIAFRIKEISSGEASPVKILPVDRGTDPARKHERVPLSEGTKDPFLGRMPPKREAGKTPTREKTVMEPRWPNVIYQGCITSEKNRRLGIVTWEGKPYHVREAGRIEGIKILVIKEGYIILEQKGKTIQIDKTGKGGET
jgi:hypothetical protein